MEENPLGFVTIEGLLAYGHAMARCSKLKGLHLPDVPIETGRSAQLVLDAMGHILAFVKQAQKGFPHAEGYRAARQDVITSGCRGDEWIFYAAWNRLLAEERLSPLLRTPIPSIEKPIRRRPTAIISREHLTSHLAEGRILLDLGNDRFWLLPRDLTGRSILFAMRHGQSVVESKTHRVGRRLANFLNPQEGVAKADLLGEMFARMIGVVGQQLNFLHMDNYLDPRHFAHLVSQSPNTTELFERIAQALQGAGGEQPKAAVDPALESQDFGWVTGQEKAIELEEAARAFKVDTKTAKRLIKHPLYCYPGGHSFFDLYLEVVEGMHRIGRLYQGAVACLYTHSSTLRALMLYLDPRPFPEAFLEFGEHKEGQNNVVLLMREKNQFSGYATAVGLAEHEKTARDAWVTVEKERVDRVTLKPKQIKRVVVLVSGGDFAGAGAALKELHVTGSRYGIEIYFVQHGFLGLANNWIERVYEEETRGMASRASSPIGSSRFEEFKDERIQQVAIGHLTPYMENGALIVIGGDGSLRGLRALYQNFGIQCVGLPGSIDNDIAGTTSLGFHSAVAIANQSIESLKATSAAMGSVFFVEIMGAGSGHLALACAYQARAEGVLVNEYPDPDAYIDDVILGTLKRSLGVPNKSHLFVVAEKTPHRHHPQGGVYGLVDYVENAIAQWPRPHAGPYQMALATKTTILGHTVRGAPPTPEDKSMAQHLGYEAIRCLVEAPERVVGCMLAYRIEKRVDPVPLHAICSKEFDWELFSRMHGDDQGETHAG